MLRLLRFFTRARRAPMEPLIAVVGATGTGKSKLAVDLATRFNGEVINGDAMQMYRGLPIITNQIPEHERNGIPHHLIGTRSIEQQPWRITHFKRECLRIIQEIRSRGKLPILVGGTHYYTQSVLFNEPLLDEGASDEEGSDDEKFAILDAPVEEMYEKLKEVDPAMANRWHPKESRRIRRSLQIYLQTGRKASEIYAEQKRQLDTPTLFEEDSSAPETPAEPSSQPGKFRYPTVIFWTHTEKEQLQKRLATRIEDMAEQGLIAEAKVLFDYLEEKKSQGIDVDRTRGIWVSIGFKELEPYFLTLRSGEMSDEALERLKNHCIGLIFIATRQYSRQQIKWIRNQLWRAVVKADGARYLYPVDSTDAQNWDNDVRKPAEDVAAAFLKGEPCPDPASLPKAADHLLGAKLRSTPEVVEYKSVTCECGMTLRSEAEYLKHKGGRRHKRALKYLNNRKKRISNEEARLDLSPEPSTPGSSPAETSNPG